MRSLWSGLLLALALSMGLCACAPAFAQEANAAADTQEPKATETPKAADAASADPAVGTAPAKDSKAAEAGHDHKDHDHKDGDHSHAAHDPYDNTHANASATLSRADEMRFDLSIATFFVFALLAIILAKFAWGPIVSGLDKRENQIASMIEQARLAQEQAEAQLRSYEAKLAAAAEEARAMVAQARADADATRERELALTKAEAEKQLQRAKDDIEAAKNAALQQIAEKSVNTAISLASNIVRREVKPEDHDALVTDALSKFSKLN
jgi:F-type H+-transporting ATPase subunit b